MLRLDGQAAPRRARTSTAVAAKPGVPASLNTHTQGAQETRSETIPDHGRRLSCTDTSAPVAEHTIAAACLCAILLY